MFLVDTKDGSTWIYRGPQGGAFNGFWSNIPKLQVSDDYWREALSKLIAPGPAPVPTDLPPATNAPPPSPKPTTPPAPPPAK